MFNVFTKCFAFALILAYAAGFAAHAQDSMTPKQLEAIMMQMSQTQITDSAQGGGTEQTQLDLATLRERYKNCIVKIEFTAIRNVEETKLNPTKSERYWSSDEPPHGSGFFIGPNLILTNAHVAQEARAGSLRIKSPATGNVEFKVDVAGIADTEDIDLAVLRLREDEALRFKKRSGLDAIPYLAIGDSDDVTQGGVVAVFGYPQESDELKIIQAKVTGRQYLKKGFADFINGHQFIEVGPAGVIQPGNSGGAALNGQGEVVGIPARGNGEQGWLIPSNIVNHFLEQIKASEAGRKAIILPALGVSLAENFAGTAVWSGAPDDCIFFELGVVVREVIPGSLADEWGLKPQDIIVGFANEAGGFSAALDFQGYRVTTGSMKTWPPTGDATGNSDDPALKKTHLGEMILLCEDGDPVKLWYIRRGEKGMKTIEKPFEHKSAVPLPHLGVFEKPDFELWGDFVAQDFNDYNVKLFDVPSEQIIEGGALVTFVEPNSLASRRGMEIANRSTYGFAYYYYEEATKWVIIDSVNGEKVNNLTELRTALRKAGEKLRQAKEANGFNPERRILMRETYAEIGFRTNTLQGSVLRVTPAFPIDEALECRQVLNTPAPQE